VLRSDAKIAVLGSSGQIGRALMRLLGNRAVGFARPEADLSRMDSVLSLLEKTRPSAVINAAAYTQVDRAESEKEIAFQANGVAPGLLAEWAKNARIPFVHFSTDYVFSGSGTKPWVETDEVGPLSVYGKTKLEGERQVAQHGDRFLIFRTSWVYDSTGKNFLNTMLRLGGEKESLNVVDDQMGAPSFAGDLAAATVRALDAAVTAPIFPSGIYHMTNAGETSWYGFANKIFEKARELGLKELKIQNVQPIPAASYPTPATRPSNSRLNNAKLKTVFDIKLRAWEEALAECMSEKFK
jgi:dTDP-4-dehydrorhamnose reductase